MLSMESISTDNKPVPRAAARKLRSRRGFSLVIVIAVTAVMFLLSAVLFLRNSSQRRDGLSQRAATDTFYAAEAGLNQLGGRLSAGQFGVSSIDLTTLPFVTTANIDPAQAAADAANGTLGLGSAYNGATPQVLGNGLGFVVYGVRSYTCNTGTVPCTQYTLDAARPGSFNNSTARIDVQAIGFRDRGAATLLQVSIFPNVQGVFASNRYAAFGRSSVNVQNGDSFSALPFCKYNSTKNPPVDCSQVTYIRGIYRNKTTGSVAWITDDSTPSLASAINSICSSLSQCERVSDIYQDASGRAQFVTASNQPASGWRRWEAVDPQTGMAKPLPLNPGDTTGTSNLAPAFPAETIVGSSGSYTVDPSYPYIPLGDLGNLGTNGEGSSGSTAVSNLSGSTINGSVASACGSSCVSLTTTPTGGVQTIPPLNFPAAPEPPTANLTCTLSNNGTATNCGGTQAIVPQVINANATGADKYQVVSLSGSNGGGVSISGNNTLTLYSGRYIITDLDISGNASLKIVQTNGDPVVLYVINQANVAQVETLSISGNGIANTSTAAGLQIYSNSSNTLKLNGNGALRAVIYAPNGSLDLNGGGNSGYLVGSYLGKTVTFSGNNPKAVYDESLNRAQLPIRSALNVTMRNWRRQ
jgi:hypothetical protein